MELVLFLEERSAKVFLDGLLPRVLPPEVPFRTIPHNGKRDLQASLPRKLRGWRNPGARFVVVHDKDSNDCVELKTQLRDICQAARPDLHPLIRIACHELEAWYLGDFDALESAFPGFNASLFRHRAKFRDVDAIANAAEELGKLVPAYQKMSGSRELGKVLDAGKNTSNSFRVFIEGIRHLLR